MTQLTWEGRLRNEIEDRNKELTSVALLARRDIDRHLWLSKCRPDLAEFAPPPPGLQIVTRKRKKKKNVDGPKATREQYSSNRRLEDFKDLFPSAGREIRDVLKFFSKLDVDLQQLLLEVITTHSKRKTQDVFVQKHGRKPTLAWLTIDHDIKPPLGEPIQLRTSHLKSKPYPIEDGGLCAVKERADFLSSDGQRHSCVDRKTNTRRFSKTHAEWSSDGSNRLRGGSYQNERINGNGFSSSRADSLVISFPGACRDVAIQTHKFSEKASKEKHNARRQSWEILRPSTNHWPKVSSARPNLEATKHLEVEEIENLRTQVTVDILERWAEPLESYLSTLQEFEQELRDRWLTPEEQESMLNSRTITADLDPECPHHDSKFLCMTLNAQTQRMSPAEIQLRSNDPLHTTDLESESLKSSWTRNHAAGDRRITLSKLDLERSAANESRMNAHYKPDWWPPLRRPYSESEIGAMRQRKDTQKVTRKSPAKIKTGYPAKRPLAQPSLKSQKSKTEHTKITINCPPARISQHPHGAARRTSNQPSDSSLLALPRHKSKPRKKTGEPRKLDTMEETEQANVDTSHSKTDHCSVHTLRNENFHELGMQNLASSTKAVGEPNSVKGSFESGDAGTAHPDEGDCIPGIELNKRLAKYEPKSVLMAPVVVLHKSGTPGQTYTQPGFTSQEGAQRELQLGPVIGLHKDETERKTKHEADTDVRQRTERLADSLIDQAVDEVASELVECCETIAEQMYMAEFMTE